MIYKATTLILFLLQIGTNGGEGYCVNIPWSCGGVGDNDYIFAFQNLVLPIGISQLLPLYNFKHLLSQ